MPDRNMQGPWVNLRLIVMSIICFIYEIFYFVGYVFLAYTLSKTNLRW